MTEAKCPHPMRLMHPIVSSIQCIAGYIKHLGPSGGQHEGDAKQSNVDQRRSGSLLAHLNG